MSPFRELHNNNLLRLTELLLWRMNQHNIWPTGIRITHKCGVITLKKQFGAHSETFQLIIYHNVTIVVIFLVVSKVLLKGVQTFALNYEFFSTAFFFIQTKTFETNLSIHVAIILHINTHKASSWADLWIGLGHNMSHPWARRSAGTHVFPNEIPSLPKAPLSVWRKSRAEVNALCQHWQPGEPRAINSERERHFLLVNAILNYYYFIW